MRNSIEWLEAGVNRAPEERATLAEWRLFLSGQNVCLHLDGADSVDHVTLPLYALAEGVAHDWWALFGGRDREISFVRHRMDFAVPDVRLMFDGMGFEVAAHQRSYRNPDVRFWAGPSETLSRLQAEEALSELVGRVLARLCSKNVGGTALKHRWARVNASRASPDESAFCEAAGALGLDPYAIDEGAADLIEQAADLFTGEALLEFLNGIRTGSGRGGEVIDWVAEVERRPRHHARLPALREVAQRSAQRVPARDEPAWARGYRRARAARFVLDWNPRHRVLSYKAAAERLGAPYFRLARPVDGLAALRTDRDDGVYIHLRRLGRSRSMASGHTVTFAFARALGDAACFPDGGRAVVNELHDASRQAAGRAFAAEFLAPVEELVALRAQGWDAARIADAFAVSPWLVERQLENLARIRTACD